MNLRFEADLDRDALRGLVARIAAQPALWRPLVRLDAGAAPLRASCGGTTTWTSG